MNDDNKAVYEALNDVQKSGESVALATIISTQGSIPRHAGSKMIVHADGSIVGTVGGGTMEQLVIKEALAALSDGKTRFETYSLNSTDGAPGVCGGTAQIFIEPIGVIPTLLVIGVGHVGKAVAELGKWMGFRVIACDDRAELCSENELPGMDEYVICKADEVTKQIDVNSQTYIAAMTRGVDVDVELVPSLLESEAPYIGIIGSRRRWQVTSGKLKEHNTTDEQLARINSPVGLEIQAETPKEIALSIMAEIIMLRRGGTGKPMKV